MKMSIYVDDELGERAKAVPGLNISALCRAALTKELERRDRLAGLSKEMERVEAYTDQGRVWFTATLLTTYDPPGSDGPFGVYLTKKGNIVVSGEDRKGHVFETYATHEALADDWGGHPELVADVADALGLDFVRELDI